MERLLWMEDRLQGKIRNNIIGIRILEGHKFSRIGRETNETLPIHLSGLHFMNIRWNRIVKIKLRMKSIS